MFNFKSIFGSSKLVCPVEAAALAASVRVLAENYEAEQQKLLVEAKMQEARIQRAEQKAEDDYLAEKLKWEKEISKEASQILGDIKAMKANVAKNKTASISENIKIHSILDELNNL